MVRRVPFKHTAKTDSNNTAFQGHPTPKFVLPAARALKWGSARDPQPPTAIVARCHRATRAVAIVFRRARGARTAGCGQPPRPWLASIVPDASLARELRHSRPPRRSTHPHLPSFASDVVSNFTPEAEYRRPRVWRLSLGLARATRSPTLSVRSFSAVGSRAARQTGGPHRHSRHD